MVVGVFEIAIRVNPRKPENFFSRAGVFFMLGKFKDALTDYTSVINLYPAADVYNARGATYLRMGETALAEKDFEMARTEGMPATLGMYFQRK